MLKTLSKSTFFLQKQCLTSSILTTTISNYKLHYHNALTIGRTSTFKKTNQTILFNNQNANSLNKSFHTLSFIQKEEQIINENDIYEKQEPRITQEDITKAKNELLNNGIMTPNYIYYMLNTFLGGKNLPIEEVNKLLILGKDIFKKENTLMEVNVSDKNIVVCGDTHGQFGGLLKIFELNNAFPSKDTPFIFNGDFVDRGRHSCEVFLTLLSFKLLDPEAIYLNRGNHEYDELNKRYGFYQEVLNKYGSETYEYFQQVFDNLPLATVLNKQVFIVHGGIGSEYLNTLEDISNFKKGNRQYRDGTVEMDLMWSDPTDKRKGLSFNSQRGASHYFGADVTSDFLERNGLGLLVRSHEVVSDGYKVMHDGKCITVFSAPYYGGRQNYGAYIVFKGSDMSYEIFSFA
ncbi:hypothetical protein ABK040_012437 [Willaertia magna]